MQSAEYCCRTSTRGIACIRTVNIACLIRCSITLIANHGVPVIRIMHISPGKSIPGRQVGTENGISFPLLLPLVCCRANKINNWEKNEEGEIARLLQQQHHHPQATLLQHHLAVNLTGSSPRRQHGRIDCRTIEGRQDARLRAGRSRSITNKFSTPSLTQAFRRQANGTDSARFTESGEPMQQRRQPQPLIIRYG